jgi:hypothetical protein
MKLATLASATQAVCLATLCATALLAPAHAASAPAHAASAPDLSHAIVASGPAGTIANGALIDVGGGSASIQYNFFTLDKSGWISGGSGVGLLPYTVSADGASLVTQFDNVKFGVEMRTVDPMGRTTAPYTYERSIQASGGLYQDLKDPASTSLQFTFAGTSAAAGNAVAAHVYFTDPQGQVFDQSATWNQAGNWTLTLTTPLGYEIKTLGIGVSGLGSNTLTSVRITPMLAAVPEASTLAMMGLGLVGLAWARRQGRTH